MLTILTATLPSALTLMGPLALPAPSLAATPFAQDSLAPALEVDGVTLQTVYADLQMMRVEKQVSFTIETTVMEMEVDGEPRDAAGNLGGPTTSSMSHTHTDDFVALTDGVPTHIKRKFGEFKAGVETEEGEIEMPANPRMPADGLVLEIKIDENGEQKIKVVEGEAPENEKFMAQQPMSLALDGLLSGEPVEVDGKWDLESDAIRGALGALLPEPGPRPERGEGRRRGGDDQVSQDGRRQGRRGMRGSGQLRQYFQEAEWEGEAKLISLEKEFEGTVCAVIELELTSEGALPERQGGGGRRGGEGRQVQPWWPANLPLEGEVSVTLKGKLYYSIEGKHPVAMQLEGPLNASNSIERDRGDRHISMYSEQEGKIELSYRFAHEER